MKQMIEYGSNETRALYHAVFVDTSLDTHLALLVSDADTVYDLKQKIVLEHSVCFPNFGEVDVHALKIKRKANRYHMSDSMLVKTAFLGETKTWFILADISSRNPDLLPVPLPTKSQQAIECPPENNNVSTKCLPTQQIVSCKNDANFRTSSSDSGRRSGPLDQKGHDLSDEVNKLFAIDGESKKKHIKTGISGGPYGASDEEGSRSTARKRKRKKKEAGDRLISGGDDVLGDTYDENEPAVIISSVGPLCEDKTALEINQTLDHICEGNGFVNTQSNKIKGIQVSQTDDPGNDTMKMKHGLLNSPSLPEHDTSMGSLAEPIEPLKAIEKSEIIFQDDTVQHACSDNALPGHGTLKDKTNKEPIRLDGIPDNVHAENKTASVGGAPEAGMKRVKRRKTGDDVVTSSAPVDTSGDLEGDIHHSELSHTHTNQAEEAFENNTKLFAIEPSASDSKEVEINVKRPKKGKKTKGSGSKLLELAQKERMEDQMTCTSLSVPAEDHVTHKMTSEDDTQVEGVFVTGKDKQSKLNCDVNSHEPVEMEAGDVGNVDEVSPVPSQVREGRSPARTTELDSDPGHVHGPIPSGLVPVASAKDDNGNDNPSGMQVKAGFQEVVSKNPQADMVSAPEHLSGVGSSEANVNCGSSNIIKEQGLGEDIAQTEEVRSVHLPELQETKSKSKKKTKKKKDPSTTVEDPLDCLPVEQEKSFNVNRSKDGVSHGDLVVPLQVTPVHTSEEDKKHKSKKRKKISKEQQASDAGGVSQPLKEQDAKVKYDGSELETSGLPISESDVRNSVPGVDDKSSKLNFSDDDLGRCKETDPIQQSKRSTKKQQVLNTKNPPESSQTEQDAQVNSDELRLKKFAALPTAESDMKSSENRIDGDSVRSQSVNFAELRREVDVVSQSESDILPLTQVHRVEEGNKGNSDRHTRKKKKQKSTGDAVSESLPKVQEGTVPISEKDEHQKDVAVPKPESDIKGSETRIDDKFPRSDSCNDEENQKDVNSPDQRDSETLQATPAHTIEGKVKIKSERPKRRTRSQQDPDLNIPKSSPKEQDTKSKPDRLELDSSVAKNKHKSSASQSGLKSSSKSSKDKVVAKPGDDQSKCKSHVIHPTQSNNTSGDDLDLQPVSVRSDSVRQNFNQGRKIAKQLLPGADQLKPKDVHPTQSNNTASNDVDFRSAFQPLSARSDSSLKMQDTKAKPNQGSKIAKQLPVSKMPPVSMGKSSSNKMAKNVKNSPIKKSLIGRSGSIFSQESSSSSDEDEENGEQNSGGSSKAPSDDTSISDYSEGESKGNWVSPKHDVTKDGSKVIPRSSNRKKPNNLQSMFKNSSNFKKTQSRLEESQGDM